MKSHLIVASIPLCLHESRNNQLNAWNCQVPCSFPLNTDMRTAASSSCRHPQQRDKQLSSDHGHDHPPLDDECNHEKDWSSGPLRDQAGFGQTTQDHRQLHVRTTYQVGEEPQT